MNSKRITKENKRKQEKTRENKRKNDEFDP